MISKKDLSKMRTIVLAMVAAMAATSVSAMDLPVAGLALNTDVVAAHKVDAETTTLVATPELAYTYGAATLTAATTVNIWDNAGGVTVADTFDVLPTVEFGASYMMRNDLELEALTSYDFDAKARGEITLQATFSF